MSMLDVGPLESVRGILRILIGKGGYAEGSRLCCWFTRRHGERPELAEDCNVNVNRIARGGAEPRRVAVRTATATDLGGAGLSDPRLVNAWMR